MTLKRYKKAIIITVSVLVAVVATGIGIYFALHSCFPYNHDAGHAGYLDVVETAKQEYGCDKVLWYQPCRNNSLLLPKGVKIQSEKVYCVVAEKNDDEVFLVIPSEHDKEKGFFAEWKFDFSFTEIMSKMKSLGIPCEPYSDGMQNTMYRSDEISLVEFDEIKDKYSVYYRGCDLNAYWGYAYNKGENNNSDVTEINAFCVAMQKNHELVIYSWDMHSDEYTLLT